LDKKESAKIFHLLGRVYWERSFHKNADQKRCLIKSSVLFNAALARTGRNAEEIKDDLERLSKRALSLAGFAANTMSLGEKADLVSQKVKKMRVKVKDELQVIEKPDYIYEDVDGQMQMVKDVEALQEGVYAYYCEIMIDLMDFCTSNRNCVECKYALVAMGSLAKKEVTPYSDFEHAILLEENVLTRGDLEDVLEYFRWASVIFQLVLVNLGETIVPNINLPFLNNPFNKDNNWFFEVNPIRGISFDGMTPYACKFPLGRTETPRKPWKTELIQPVSKMLNYLKRREAKKNGYHLADMLTKTCLVHGSKEVYESFTTGAKSYLCGDDLHEDFNRYMKKDIQNFNPVSGLDSMHKKAQWNLKRVVYRSLGLFVEALGKAFKQEINSSFETIRLLRNAEIIQEGFAHNLLFASAIACYLRLCIYAEKNSQDDLMDSPQNADEFASLFAQRMGVKTVITFFQTVMELQRFVCIKVRMADSPFLQLSKNLDHILVCFWLKQYDNVINESRLLLENARIDVPEAEMAVQMLLLIGQSHYEQGFHEKSRDVILLAYKKWNDLENYSSEDSPADSTRTPKNLEKGENEVIPVTNVQQEQIRKQLPEESDENTVSIIPYNSNEKENFVLAENQQVRKKIRMVTEYSEGAHQAKTFDFAEALFVIGQCHFSLGEYEKAMYYHQEAASLKTKDKFEASANQDIAFYLLRGAESAFHLKQYINAEENCLKANAILKLKQDVISVLLLTRSLTLVGECYFSQKDYDQALQHYNEALRKILEYSDDQTLYPVISTCLGHVARCLFNLKRCEEAISLWRKAEKILEDTARLKYAANIARYSERIGECHLEMLEYEEALSCLEKAINLKTKISSDKTTDVDIATSLVSAANCNFALKKYSQAKSIYMKALEIWKNNDDVSYRRVIAATLVRMGQCHVETCEYELALHYYQESIKLKTEVSDNFSKDEEIAICIWATAKCNLKMKNYSEALKSYQEALAIWKNNTKQQHEQVLCYSEACLCLYEMKDYEEALKYCEDALQLQMKISDEIAEDSNVAQCWSYVADCKFALGNFEEAGLAYAEAIKIWRTNEDVRYQVSMTACENKLGQCCFELMDYNQAVCHYKEALKLRIQTSDDLETDANFALCLWNLAECMFVTKDYGNAEENYLRSKAIWERTSDAQYKTHIAECSNKLGLCWFKLKNYETAKKHLQEAIEIKSEISNDVSRDTDIARFMKNIAKCLLKSKNYPQARRGYVAAKTLWETNGAANFASEIIYCIDKIGECYYEEQSFVEALECYEESVRLNTSLSTQVSTDPNIAISLYNAAKCEYAMKNYVKTKELYAKAKGIWLAESETQYAKAVSQCLNRIGLCHFDLREYEEALTYFQEAANFRIRNSDGSAANTEAAASFIRNAAQCLYHTQRYSEAIELLAQAKIFWEKSEDMQNTSNIADCLNEIGDCCFEMQKYQQAQHNYETSLVLKLEGSCDSSIDPSVAMSYWNVAKCLFQQKDYLKASEHFKKAMRIWINVGDFEYKAGIIECMNKIGQCYSFNHEHKQALINHKEAVALKIEISDDKTSDLDLAIYLWNLARCAVENEMYLEAVEYYEQAKAIWENSGDVQYSGDIADCLNDIGKCYFETLDLAEALECYEKSIELYSSINQGDANCSGIADILWNAANVAFELKNYPKARNYYERAKKIWEDKGDMMLTKNIVKSSDRLGQCFYHTHAYQQALEHHKNSLKLTTALSHAIITDPAIADCRKNVAECLFGLNRYLEAEEEYAEAKSIWENNADSCFTSNIVDCLHGMGRCRLELQDHVKALRNFESALTLGTNRDKKKSADPVTALCAWNAAECAFELRKYSEASEYYAYAKIVWETSQEHNSMKMSSNVPLKYASAIRNYSSNGKAFYAAFSE